MRELLVMNICASLGYSAVALLVWWVAEEGLRAPVIKLLALKRETNQLVAVAGVDGPSNRRTLGKI